jgi:enoyl-CoA hydratase
MSATATTAATGAVRLDREPPIATLTLDRAAKRNALTPEMLRQLDAHLVALADDPTVRVVLVRGAGDRAFCAGADIDRFASLGPADMWRSWTALGHAVFDRLAALPQPVIAVLHGNAFGGGLELALAADFRVISAGASVGLPEAGLGTVPGWGGTERLVDAVGRARAKDIVLARTIVDGPTAHAWGLVSRCVPPAQLEDAVDELCAALAAGAPVAVQVAKQLIDACADGAPSRVLEPLAGALTATTADLAEGVAAFRARRPATFTGH